MKPAESARITWWLPMRMRRAACPPASFFASR